MSVPTPTPIYRFIHVDNLHIYLRRGGLHAPNCTPSDGLAYKTIHNVDIQNQRRITAIPCGPGGVIHDYVAFYFGPRSPMLFQLHTGWKTDYRETQEPLIYLVSTAQAVAASNTGFAFSDGHGIAYYTQWFGDLGDLDKVDWKTVYANYWRDDVDDMDRQRRKQAEFIVHRFCEWSLIREIAVVNAGMKGKVEAVLSRFAREFHRSVHVRPEWYY